MQNTEFKMIPVKEIKPDPNQPRKFYDERGMLELSQSVKENGVIQPILIRPAKKGYMIVCGERRYRACKDCNLTEVPAVIRELTNEQALELQIIENLQRKDVHPMEEAVAFKSLSDNLNIEEIALKVGKSASYVAKRIKLNDLVPDAQTIYFGGHMSHSDALLMSRADQEIQEEIIREVAPKNWKTKKDDWSLGNIIWYLNNSEILLSEAVFKLNDTKLYPEAGACTNCPHNSLNQPLLFEDQKKKVCTKPSCFKIKTKLFRKIQFEKIATDPEIVCIVNTSYLDEDDKAVIEAAKEAGINILERKLYDGVYVEEPSKSFDEWFEDEKWDYDESDDEEGEEKFDMDRAKHDYDQYKIENDKDYQKYQDDIKSGLIVKAYVIVGNNAGKYIDIKLKSTAAKDIVDKGAGNAGNSEILEEIAGITQREQRNKELDAEKIWQKVIEFARNDEDGLLKNSGQLSLTELKAFARAIKIATGYSYRKHIEKMFEEDGKPDINSLCRLLILDKLIANYGSHESNSDNKIAFQYIKSIHPKEISKIELEQKEKAEQREARAKKRIEALTNKLST